MLVWCKEEFQRWGVLSGVDVMVLELRNAKVVTHRNFRRGFLASFLE